jgi:hypothetical protein
MIIEVLCSGSVRLWQFFTRIILLFYSFSLFFLLPSLFPSLKNQMRQKNKYKDSKSHGVPRILAIRNWNFHHHHHLVQSQIVQFHNHIKTCIRCHKEAKRLIERCRTCRNHATKLIPYSNKWCPLRCWWVISSKGN